MTQPLVGIAVVSFNTKAYWPRLRAALDAQTERSFQLLVVDNASRPDQRLDAHDMPPNGALWQMEDNLGFAAANNAACEKLDAEFFACLNPDAFPEPNWLERLIAAARADDRIGAVGSLQISADDPELLDGAGDVYWAGGLPYRSLYRRKRPAALPPGETFSACAAAALYRRAAYREAGGFDERFFCYCEDVDLGFRLRLLGWKTVQADDAVVAHVGGGSAGAKSDFAVRLGTRNRMWTFLKNMPAPLLIALLPVHAAMTLFVLAWSVFRGTARATWAGVGAGLGGLGPVLATRTHVQSARRVSSAELMRAFAWSPLKVVRRAAVRQPISPSRQQRNPK